MIAQDTRIHTFTGLEFFPFAPDEAHVNIVDIAPALARQCRYGGHVSCEHYSVAEHCVLVSLLVLVERRVVARIAQLDQHALGLPLRATEATSKWNGLGASVPVTAALPRTASRVPEGSAPQRVSAARYRRVLGSGVIARVGGP